jgi:hypothetical protein
MKTIICYLSLTVALVSYAQLFISVSAGIVAIIAGAPAAIRNIKAFFKWIKTLR